MLLQFTFSNYKSFREAQTLSMAANRRIKHSRSSTISSKAPGLEEKEWVKGAVLYGPNASGKSTVLDALRALQAMVVTSAATTDPTQTIKQIEPFLLAPDDPDAPTAFAVVFVEDNVRYEYRVAATAKQIWHESLRAFPNNYEQVWFNRDWDPTRRSYEWSPERPSGFKRDTTLEGYTLPNGLFLSKAVANNKEELRPVFLWFRERLVFLDLSVKAAGPSLGTDFTARHLGEKSDLTANILRLLRHADINVTDATATERKPAEFDKILAQLPESVRAEFRAKRWFAPELYHRGPRNDRVPLPWESESAGTHRLFALAGPWLDILLRGRVVCIDELETSMHPLMVRELLRIFLCADENRNGAQLIFTTHSPELLDLTLIRRDQVWFCDKDDHGIGHLYSLMDYQPRIGESLARGYLAGRYGAIPFVPHGLLGNLRREDINIVQDE